MVQKKSMRPNVKIHRRSPGVEASKQGVLVRLNKHLAQLGIASRRKIDELIERNQVWVNGRRAGLGMKINPTEDTIRIGKKEYAPTTQAPELEYWLVYKPVGYVSTTQDPDGRRTVVSLVKSRQRLFPVGRLDVDSEGLILLTNDGALTQQLTHPRHHVPKMYRVRVKGRLTSASLDRIRFGLKLKWERLAPAQVEVVEEDQGSAVLEIILHQGVNRQIRRMMQAINLEVTRLVRVQFGPLEIGNMRAGESRPLTSGEVAHVKKL